ncbi:MAG: PAS domain S-box protein, partial [Planctomycetes bacterium]|nr:PAS domain S-box protein [Planctomycetota bacterium]
MQKLPSITENTRSHMILVLAGVLFLGVLALDLSLPLGVAAGVSYVAVVLLGWWLDRNRYIFIFAIIASLLTWVGYLYSPEGGIHWMVVNNRILSIFAIWNTAILLYLVKRSHSAAHDSLKSLQQEIANRIRIEVETSQDLVWSLDRDGRFTYLNPVWESTLGYDLPEMLGRRFTDFHDPEEASRTFKVFQQILKGESVTDFERTYLAKSGNEIFLNFKVVPKYDFSGQICGTQGTAIDITERKKAEEGLRESRDQMRLVMDHIPAPVVFVDADLRYRLVNKAAAAWFGQSQDDLVGRDYRELFPASSVAKFQPHIEKVLAGEVQAQDLDILYPDGLTRSVHTTYVPHVGAEGAVRGYFGLVVDFTERKRAEEALRESEARIRAIADSVPVLLTYIDKHHRYQFTNKIFDEWLGTAPGELIGKHLRDVLGNEIYEKILPDVEGVFTGEQQVNEREMLYQHLEKRHVQYRYTPHFDNNNEVIGFFSAVMDLTERKWAEKAQMESEELLNTFFKVAPLQLATKDQHGRYVSVNKGWCEFYGTTPEAVVGRLPTELSFWSKERAIQIQQEDQRAMADGASIYPDQLWENKSGASYWVQTLKVAIEGNEGEKKGLVALALNITEQKRVEAALHESESKYRDLVESSQDLIWRLDEGGHFTYLNPVWEQTLGYDREEMLGRLFTDFKNPAEAARTIKVYKETLAGGNVTNFETTYISKSRQEHTLKFNAKPICDSRGNIIGTKGTAQDITERNRAEELLRKSEERLRAIVDHSPSQIILKDLKYRYLLVNRHFEEWHGVSNKNVIGKTILEVFPGEYGKKVMEQEQEVVRTGEVIERELEVPSPDGSTRTTINTKFPVLDDKGRITGVGTITTDVHDRKNLEEQLRQSQKMEALGTLAGGIAHDFNNILTPILGYSEMMLKNAKAQSGELDYINVILRSAIRAKDLVSQILLFSRRSQSDKSISDLSSIVKEVVKFMRSTLPTAISVQQHISGDVAPVFCNPSQMHQMILNLCVNAGQAMTETGILRITLNTVELGGLKCIVGKILSGNHVRLTVTDTGMGMDNETLSHIFDPFFTTK